MERHILQIPADRGAKRGEGVSHGVEFAWRRALEREDGLLLVADGEDRAVDGARAGAGKKLSRQKPNDLPLLRAGILGLVDQHVVDALIALLVRPGRAILTQ